MGRLIEVFSENLQRFRKEAGLSQEELADKIGASRNTVSRYESGEFPPSFEAIEKLSEALGLDETTLLTDPEVIKIWEKMTDLVETEVMDRMDVVANDLRKRAGKDLIPERPKKAPADPSRARRAPYWPHLVKAKKTILKGRK